MPKFTEWDPRWALSRASVAPEVSMEEEAAGASTSQDHWALPPTPPHLKHHLRSGVPSELLPTVTISPERKAFLRNTGKERSMSRMVVAHCREGGGGGM